MDWEFFLNKNAPEMIFFNKSVLKKKLNKKQQDKH